MREPISPRRRDQPTLRSARRKSGPQLRAAPGRIGTDLLAPCALPVIFAVVARPRQCLVAAAPFVLVVPQALIHARKALFVTQHRRCPYFARKILFALPIPLRRKHVPVDRSRGSEALRQVLNAAQLPRIVPRRPGNFVQLLVA